VTGGAQGIGLGISRALARRGVSVAIADIDERALSAAHRELAASTEVSTHLLDVRDRDRFAEVADLVEADLGPVNLLFNNAGVAPYASLSKLSYDLWDLSLDVNLNGVVNGVQTFIPRMIARGKGGYVVNTASGAGLVAGGNVLYTTAKYAVVGLSESLKEAGAKYGIQASVLCPGFVNTDILENTKSIGGPGRSVTQPGRGGQESAAALARGASADDVGELVMAGMAQGAMWIHTDALVHPYAKLRMEALLASFEALDEVA
jgi:NAD(P)-dependent dehydrogenase (short-subunit alcohol dehydrogenase family)